MSVKFSCTWGLLLKDHNVKVDGAVDDLWSCLFSTRCPIRQVRTMHVHVNRLGNANVTLCDRHTGMLCGGEPHGRAVCRRCYLQQ